MLQERHDVLKPLIQRLYSLSFIYACWEGGSAATHSMDQYSDLDLRLIVADDQVEATFLAIEQILQSISPIKHRRREPEPAWHGHSHCFYQLQNHSECFFLDILVMKVTSSGKPLDKERHGEPVIQFDKRQLIRVVSSDTEDFIKKRCQKFNDLILVFPFLKIATLKCIYRNQPLDAFARYHQLLNCLVELWGMKYRPFRYDFGLRYTQCDLPKDIQAKLEAFCFSDNLLRLEKNIKEIENSFFEVMSELRKEYFQSEINEQRS